MRKNILIFTVIFLMIESFCFSKKPARIILNELYISSGRFVVSDNSIITIDNKDYTLKVFSITGKLIKKKTIKGNGPGEVSTLGTFIFPDGKGFMIIESQKRKWLKYDKKLGFIKEGKLDEPVTVITKVKNGYIAGEASFAQKYFRKIFFYTDDFSKKREIYVEYGRDFGKRLDTRELYMTIDSKGNKFAISGGNKPVVKVLSFSGKILDKIDLTEKINPSKYGKEELSSILKNIPPEMRKIMEFETYPPVTALLFLSETKLLIVSGEKNRERYFKSFLYNMDGKKLKEIKNIPEGNTYVFQSGKLFIMNEGEEAPYIIIMNIKEVL